MHTCSRAGPSTYQRWGRRLLAWTVWTLSGAAVGVGCVSTGGGGAERAGHGHAARAVRGAWGPTDGAEVPPQRARPLLPARERPDAHQEDRRDALEQGHAAGLEPRNVAMPRGGKPPCTSRKRLEHRGTHPLEAGGRAAARPHCRQRPPRRPAAARPWRGVPPRSPTARGEPRTGDPRAGRLRPKPVASTVDHTQQTARIGRPCATRRRVCLACPPHPALLPCRVPTTASAGPDAVQRRRPGAAPDARTGRRGHTRGTATGRRGRQQRPRRAAAPRCGGAPTAEPAPAAAAVAAATTAAPAAPPNPRPAACNGAGRQPRAPDGSDADAVGHTDAHALPPAARAASDGTDRRRWPQRRTTPRARRRPR